ncbi:MAG: GDSL-type esterase/lipase family protein [Cellulosilyticaceae bacterium]
MNSAEKVLKEGYIQSAEPWNYVVNRRETFEVLAPQKDCILFIGDSITQRNEWAEMFENPKILNRGIDSDRISWLQMRMPNILSNTPTKIFIKIGINDIMDGKPAAQMIEEYEELLQQFKTLEGTQVFVQSCLPVNNSVYAHPINNERVQAFNAALKELVTAYDYTFVNLYDHFVTQNNELESEYTRDGVHLNGAGYLVWKKQIEDLVK